MMVRRSDARDGDRQDFGVAGHGAKSSRRLKQAMGENAITWDTAWQDMFANGSGPVLDARDRAQREY